MNLVKKLKTKPNYNYLQHIDNKFYLPKNEFDLQSYGSFTRTKQNFLA